MATITTTTTTITSHVTFHLLPDSPGHAIRPVPVILQWSTTAPLEVTMHFGEARNEPTWVIDRQLLTDGLTKPAGLGDVTVGPTVFGHVELALNPPNGTATFMMDHRDLVEFLDATWKILPADSEIPLVTDRELQQLIAG